MSVRHERPSKKRPCQFLNGLDPEFVRGSERGLGGLPRPSSSPKSKEPSSDGASATPYLFIFLSSIFLFSGAWIADNTG